MVDCIRRAWLVLGDSQLSLEDEVLGYFCSELNLGYPEVREVMNNRPNMNGVDDRSQFFGSRAVSVNITARGGGATIDQIASALAHFMVPWLRPQLHFVLERPGNPERFVTVRSANYDWPITGAHSRNLQLSWVAADPTVYAAAESSAQSMTGTGGLTVDRVYDLTYDRIYGVTGGGIATTGLIESEGELPIRPIFRIYGPITEPLITLNITDGGATHTIYLRFHPGVIVADGHHIEINSLQHTARYNGDPAQSVLHDMDWATSTWPVLPVLPEHTTMSLTGSSVLATTQAVASWHDGYIT